MNEVKSMPDLFGNFHLVVSGKPIDERRTLLQYFVDKTGYPIGRIVKKLEKIQDIKTLYFVKSSMEDLVRTGKKADYRHAFNSVTYNPKI